MSVKRTSKKIKKLLAELEGFVHEIDTTDPEWTQVLFKERVSNLIRDKVLKTDKMPWKVNLTDVLELVLGRVDSDLLETAETFDDALSSYGAEPDEDEMNHAYDAVVEIVKRLGNIRGVDNAS